MKLERRNTAHRTTAQALRDLIHAELAHERAGAHGSADDVRADELAAQVSQARERYLGLTGADA